MKTLEYRDFVCIAADVKLGSKKTDIPFTIFVNIYEPQLPVFTSFRNSQEAH